MIMVRRKLADTPEARKRRNVMRLRKLVKVHARFDVRDLGDGREEQKCRTCGAGTIYTYVGTYGPVHKKLIAYRAHNNGVSGVCISCSIKLAKERYPLPEDKP